MKSFAAAIAFAAVALMSPAVGATAAQSPAQAQPPAAAALPTISLTTGRSTVLTTDFNVTRIAVTNPAVADATVVQPHEILIDGKGAGTISLIVWGADRRVQYDVVVQPPTPPLQLQLSGLFPGEDIQVAVTEEATTLSGRVSSTAVMLKAAEIATKTSAKTNVINLLQVPGGTSSQQVMLQVRFAEVNRQALTEVGVTLFTGPSGYKDWVGRSSTQQFAGPTYNPDGTTTTFSDLLNLFLFNTKYNVGALLKALETKGFLQSLAEPNLIAYNGQEASFLAGGEVPVPVIQGAGSLGTVTIIFKEFGIRLGFKPTIAGDVIRLHVKPEVSTLDYSNGVTLSGFRIPALTTRRAETEVELRDGQSFAIAGLMNHVTQTTGNSIPWLGSIPIIGNLFKSKSDSKSETELMVLITPHLVQALDPDEVPALPTDPTRFLLPQPQQKGVGGDLQGGGGAVDGPPVASATAPAKAPGKKP